MSWMRCLLACGAAHTHHALGVKLAGVGCSMTGAVARTYGSHCDGRITLWEVHLFLTV